MAKTRCILQFLNKVYQVWAYISKQKITKKLFKNCSAFSRKKLELWKFLIWKFLLTWPSSWVISSLRRDFRIQLNSPGNRSRREWNGIKTWGTFPFWPQSALDGYAMLRKLSAKKPFLLWARSNLRSSFAENWLRQITPTLSLFR
jgi:hypothetical protein